MGEISFISFIGFGGFIVLVVAIALGIYFSGLRGSLKDITSELSTIKDAVIAIRGTAEKTGDLILIPSGTSDGTVQSKLENLGKVKIIAEPAKGQTIYTIEIEKPLLKEEFFFKIVGPDFVKEETKILGAAGTTTILSPYRMRLHLPSTNPKACTEFITFLLKWLNSTYVDSLEVIKAFEEPILT